MAWEWVAPAATAASGAIGVFFTWLAGVQGRRHLLEMADRTEKKEERDRILKERRDAYLDTIRLFQAILEGESGDDPRIVHMARDANASISAFGSSDAQSCLQRWKDAGEDHPALQAAYVEFLRIARKELAD